jgi:hypothetical protein
LSSLGKYVREQAKNGLAIQQMGQGASLGGGLQEPNTPGSPFRRRFFGNKSGAGMSLLDEWDTEIKAGTSLSLEEFLTQHETRHHTKYPGE